MTIFILILAMAAYCVVKPGRFFSHYALLLVIPFYCCFLWIIFRVKTFSRNIIPSFSACTGLLLLVLVINKSSLAFDGWTPYQVSNVEVLNLLIANGNPTDRLAVWGWGSPYVHGAKLLMGTRDVHYDFQTSYTGPTGDYYKGRFLADLKQNRPKWFLDISRSGDFGSSEQNNLTYFADINKFVLANYDVLYDNGKAVLFRCKDKR